MFYAVLLLAGFVVGIVLTLLICGIRTVGSLMIIEGDEGYDYLFADLKYDIDHIRNKKVVRLNVNDATRQ